LKREEGTVEVDGYRIWYSRVGEGAVPLLTLHGGPGAGHDYLESLEALAENRTVVYYDQLGCGRSDRPDDPSLWKERLSEIRVPTLVTVGRYDEITPACAKTLHRGIPGSKTRVFEESAHVAHLEETEAYVAAVADFLARVEAGDAT
jgi:pimeloyl-ACP methyl ester carboxylesterase